MVSEIETVSQSMYLGEAVGEVQLFVGSCGCLLRLTTNKGSLFHLAIFVSIKVISKGLLVSNNISFSVSVYHKKYDCVCTSTLTI